MSKTSLTAATLCALHTTNQIMNILLWGHAKDFPMIHVDITSNSYVGSERRTVQLKAKFGIRGTRDMLGRTIRGDYSSIEATIICRMKNCNGRWRPAIVLFKRTGGGNFEWAHYHLRFDHDKHLLQYAKYGNGQGIRGEYSLNQD